MAPITPEYLDKCRNIIFNLQGRSCECWSDSDIREVMNLSRKELIATVNYHMKFKHQPHFYSHTCGMCNIVFEDPCLVVLDEIFTKHLNELHNLNVYVETATPNRGRHRNRRRSRPSVRRQYHGPYLSISDSDSDSNSDSDY